MSINMKFAGQLEARMKALAAVRNRLNGIIVPDTEYDINDNNGNNMNDIDNNKNNDNDTNNDNNNYSKNMLKTYITLKDIQNQMVPLFPPKKDPLKVIKTERNNQNIKKICNENTTFSTYEKNYQNISYSTYDNIEIIETSYKPMNSRNDAVYIVVHIKNVSR
jgi:hypothetical protein